MESITRDLEEAARERTAALPGWKELVGRLEPSEADGLEAEIPLHAVRFNGPPHRSRRPPAGRSRRRPHGPGGPP